MSPRSTFLRKKTINILSCFDATSAHIAKKLKFQAILVGDSIGILFNGNKNTKETSIETIKYHLKIIKENTDLPIIVDLPAACLSNEKIAVKFAKQLLCLGADFIKIEGHIEIINLIKKLKSNGIGLCGHIGNMPQIGEKKLSVKEYVEIASHLEDAGLDLIVLSKMTSSANQAVSKKLKIPTIGYHNDKFCRGKVDVFYSAIGLINKDELKIKVNPHSPILKYIKKNFNK